MRVISLLTLLVCSTPLWSQGRAPEPAIQPFAVVQSTGLRFAGYEDDRGGFYLVWNGQGTEGASQLMAQHLDALGAAMWPSSGQIITPALASARDWHGIADGQGNLTLYWNESDGLHVQRFRPDGSRMRPGASIHMSSSTALQPAGVPDAAGGTLVVWSEKRFPDRAVILAQHFDEQGNPMWARGGVRVSLRPSHQTNPRVLYDDLAGMIVSWRDESNESSELRVQRVDGQGNLLWGKEGMRVHGPVGKTEYPITAALGKGTAVYAWVSEVAQRNQIFLQRVGPQAQVHWGDKGMLATPQPMLYHRWNPHLESDGRGGAWVQWEDLRNQNTFQVRLTHIRADGQPAWAVGELPVAPSSAGEQGKSTIQEDGQGGVWVAWVDNRAGIGLYVQHVDAEGRLLEGPTGRLIANHLSKVEVPRMATVSPGRVVLLWADRRADKEWLLYWTYLGLASAP